MSDNSKRAILFPAMFSVNYHTLGGVRHYVLDKFPKYLNNKAMTRNSLFLFGSSLILSTITTELAKNEFKKKWYNFNLTIFIIWLVILLKIQQN